MLLRQLQRTNRFKVSEDSLKFLGQDTVLLAFVKVNDKSLALQSNIIVGKPDQILPQVTIDEQTAFVLMTHNYNYDIDLLGNLLSTNAPYIGTLGPKKKLIRMLDELGLNTEENQSRIHGPIGLDIGSETAEEIAISIVAEIKAVLTSASAGKLNEKNLPIHFIR